MATQLTSINNGLIDPKMLESSLVNTIRQGNVNGSIWGVVFSSLTGNLPKEIPRHRSSARDDTDFTLSPAERYEFKLASMASSISPSVRNADIDVYTHFVALGKECREYTDPDVKLYAKYVTFGRMAPHE